MAPSFVRPIAPLFLLALSHSFLVIAILSLWNSLKSIILKFINTPSADVIDIIIYGLFVHVKKHCCSQSLVSGSPIIQDGKLIGAEIHVLVNSPTKVYGLWMKCSKACFSV
ncbi:MAG: hypothetical protein IKC09_03520 [Oscillospiraceae bacterium]|nr:hypothetical protein [Oscillospiraceae bacterium]